MSFKLLTAPVLKALTLDEAKRQCRVDMADLDDDILDLVDTAIAEAEHLLQRAILPQKWQLTLDAFPLTCAVSPTLATLSSLGEIDLQGPISGVDSISYVDTAGVTQVLAAPAYQVVMASDYAASVVPAYGTFWPSTRVQPEAVTIVVSCGYPTIELVPKPIKQWLKQRVKLLYENPDSLPDNPIANRLLDRYVVPPA